MIHFYHVTLSSNIEAIKEQGLIPQIGKRSKACETIPAVYLFHTIPDVESALGSWLGDLFEEEDELISIELVLTKQQLMTYTVVYQPEFYESYTLETIPSEHIVKYWTELEVGSYEQTKR